MEFPPGLRLLHWNAYPRKNLPLRFFPEKLVELDMRDSQLEKLWEGTQPLTNLKKLDLSWSRELKELPDLSKATNLERLNVTRCESLVQLPLSIANLHKLEELEMFGCSRLRSFPDITTHIGTKIEETSASTRQLSRLVFPKTSTHIPTRVRRLNLSYTNIEEIPDCIKDLHGLQSLYLSGCKKLKSLPELPRSLTLLMANGCESLERVTSPLNTPNAKLIFTNCFKLVAESRKAIIQRSFRDGFACLPGSVMPTEFNNRVRGKSGSAFYKNPCVSPKIQTEHLCIFHCDLPEEEIFIEVDIEILIELRSRLNNCKIIEFGVRILTNESERSRDDSGLDQVYEDNNDWSYEFETSGHTTVGLIN